MIIYQAILFWYQLYARLWMRKFLEQKGLQTAAKHGREKDCCSIEVKKWENFDMWMCFSV